MRGRRLVPLVLGTALVLSAVLDAALQAVLRPRVMAAISQALGSPVRAERVRVGWLGGVRIRELRAGEELLVGELRADVDPLAALGGSLQPKRVLVRRLRLRLPDAAASLRQWRDRTAQPSPHAPPFAARHLPVALEMSDIEVVSARQAASVRVRAVRGLLGARTARAEAEGVQVNAGPLSMDEVACVLEAPASLTPPFALELRSGTIALQGARVAEGLSGSARLDHGGGALLARARPPSTDETPRELVLSAHFGSDGGEARITASSFPLRPLASMLARAGVLAETATIGLDVSARWLGSFGPDTDFGATGRIDVDGAGLRHGWLAARDVTGVSFSLDGSARIRGGAVHIDRAVLRSGAVRATLRATLADLASTPRLSLFATLDDTGCQDLVDALPRGLAPALSGMQLSGRLGAALALDIDWSRLDEIEPDARIDANACRVVRDPPAADVTALRSDFRHRVTDRQGRFREFMLGPGNPSYRPLNRISRHVISAFLTAEDRLFWRHSGFDVEMLGKALAHDLAAGRIEKGASTITQQLAKNLFLRQDRTLGRKLEEAVLAWRMEQVLPKRRILELYLNAIELGPGLYGVAEASHAYFGKEPAELGPLEAAHLAALTPNPRLFARRLESAEARQRWLQHLDQLLAMMQRARRVTPAEVETARAKGLRLRPHG